jgi:splicing suppressor protein 51
LIDSYRLRMHDDYTLEKKFDADGIYGGARSGLPGFQRFSRRASVLGLLPGWWSDRKATKCERVGADDHGWSSLQRKVTKGDVLTHYNDQYMPMQLRLFGEQVYGTGPGGQRGAGILQQMVLMERRGSMNHAISIMDMSQSS